MAVTHCGTHEKASVWFNKDIEGIGTSLFAEGILLFALITQLTLFIPDVSQNVFLQMVLKIADCILYLLCVYLHLQCMFTNPGAVPHNAYPSVTISGGDGDLLQRCGICDAYKPKKSHHCRICNRCILKMDHHCPWINNCVGMLNMKFFLQFLIYTFVFCTLVFICTIISLSHGIDDSDAKDLIVRGVSVVISLLFSALFGIFCLILFVESLISVITGDTKIDRLKEIESRHSRTTNLSEVFGGNGRFSLSWLLPMRPKYSNFESLAEYVLDPEGQRWTRYASDLDCFV